MSQLNNVEKMEFRIPEDIFKDMLEPGKTFERPLELDKSQKENPQRPVPSLILEKMADNIIKIIVTVSKQNDMDSPESTRNEVQQNEVSNSSQQTENAETESRKMQTDKKDEKSQQQQTEKRDEKSQQQQTEKKDEKSQQQQTEKKDEKSQQQQTEKKVYEQKGFQTVIKEFKDSSAQTTTKVYIESVMQTDIKELQESYFQTDIKEYKDIQSQTVVKEYNEILCQTDFSLANLTESDCQATVDVKDSDCQSQVDISESSVQATAENADNDSQTEIVCAEISVQTDRNESTQDCQTALSMLQMSENTSQTEVEMSSNDVQTDSSMALMEEFCCQMQPNMADMEAQTRIEVRAMPSQTENDTQYAETQTVPDVNNRETQTDEMVKTEDSPSQPAISGVQPVGVPLQIAEAGQDQLPMDGDLILPSADIQSITPLAVLPLNQIPGNAKESISIMTQTEPVTIIIGDAGFLVEKLKGGAVKTEKRDREIEIELAENGESPAAKPRPRSGYIPGSVPPSITSPSNNPPKLNPELLKSTKVTPFNPKQVENLNEYVLANKQNHTPLTEKPRKFYSDVAVKQGAVERRTPQVVQQSPVERKQVHVVKSTPPLLTTPQRPPERPQVSPLVQQGLPDPVEEEVEEEAITVLSCPFCESTFHESSTLYKHITKQHKDQRQLVHKKPVGRTINKPPKQPKLRPERDPLDDPNMPEFVRQSVEKYRQQAISQGRPVPTPYRKVGRKPINRHSDASHSSDGGYQSPPVLEPVYRVKQPVQLVGDEGTTQFVPQPKGRTYKRKLPAEEPEPSLFEDLPEPKRAYPRGRIRRDQDEQEQQVPPKAQMDAYEYECPHCPERYGSASHLYNHLKRSHRKEMDQQRVEPSELKEEKEGDDEGEEEQDESVEGQEQGGDAPEEGDEQEIEGGEEDGEIDGEEDIEEEGEAISQEEAEAAQEHEQHDEQYEEAEEGEEEDAHEQLEEHEEEQPGEPEIPTLIKAKRKRRSHAGRPSNKKQKYEDISEDDGGHNDQPPEVEQHKPQAEEDQEEVEQSEPEMPVLEPTGPPPAKQRGRRRKSKVEQQPVESSPSPAHAKRPGRPARKTRK